MIEHIRQLFAYDRWANLRILDAWVDAGLQDERVAFWLNHLVNAEWIWYERILLGATHRDLTRIAPWDRLRTDLEEIHQTWMNLLGDWEDADLYETIEYQNSKGETFRSLTKDICTHVVNHSTHHRSQVAAHLRTMGGTPPPTDYIFFVRT